MELMVCILKDSDILLTMCYADCVPVYFIMKTSFYRSSSCGGEEHRSNSSRKYVEFDYQMS